MTGTWQEMIEASVAEGLIDPEDAAAFGVALCPHCGSADRSCDIRPIYDAVFRPDKEGAQP